MRKELKTTGEMLLMGHVLPVNNADVKDLIDYVQGVMRNTNQISNKLTGEEVVQMINKYGENTVTHMCINVIMDMIMITFVLEDKDLEEEFELDSDYGVFSYVYNASHPDLSELGYTFFQYRMNRFHRVG